MAVVDEIKRLVKAQLKQLRDVRNIAMYLFVLITLAIAWSSVKTIQNNYELQKQISALQQQNQVIDLANQNIQLQNQYYRTNQYLELAARQSLGLAAPGEKIMLIPNAAAMKYVDTSLLHRYLPVEGVKADNRPDYIKNLETWRDFLLGRHLVTD
jgi:cell division protein FtsB